MLIRHDGEPLATNVDTADTWGSKIRGLMFRQSIPPNYALVFPFDTVGRRSVHMLFVRFPLDVLWLRDERVQQVKTLQPWTGFGIAKADTLIELPAGSASEVAPGDTIHLET